MKKRVLIIVLILIALFSVCFVCLRYVGTNGFKVKEYKIKYKELTDNYHGFKIVHISDIHYGSIINKKEIDDIVERINLISPDIVVFTGDLFSTEDIIDIDTSSLALSLKNINASIEKYAIMGNHDYDYKKTWEQIMDDASFKNLNYIYDYIYKDNKPIFIAGISTNLYGTLSLEDKINPIYEEMEKTDSLYNILLIHEPDYVDKIDYDKFNLILAGHSHNGQVRLPIFGAIYTPYGAKKYYEEHYKLNNTDLYISSGLGTSLLNIRFLNKHYFNYYRLNK